MKQKNRHLNVLMLFVSSSSSLFYPLVILFCIMVHAKIVNHEFWVSCLRTKRLIFSTRPYYLTILLWDLHGIFHSFLIHFYYLLKKNQQIRIGQTIKKNPQIPWNPSSTSTTKHPKKDNFFFIRTRKKKSTFSKNTSSTKISRPAPNQN